MARKLTIKTGKRRKGSVPRSTYRKIVEAVFNEHKSIPSTKSANRKSTNAAKDKSSKSASIPQEQ